MNTPKFKKGDWIKSIHSGRTARVVMLLKTCYSLRFSDDDSYCLDYSYQDNWELTDAPPKNKLEEAAEEYRRESYSKSILPNIDGPMPEYGGSIKDAFIAGAEWQKSQMLKKAVEGRVFMSFAPGHNQMVMADVDLPTNTKVRVIVLKAEEE